MPISGAISRVDEKGGAIHEIEAATDDRTHACRLLGVPGAHDARHGTAIDDAERGQSQQSRGGEQLFGR